MFEDEIQTGAVPGENPKLNSQPRIGPRQIRPIGVLPEDVASKIAAGEVVERPASVVRELIDNSIDSGARNIRIEIKAGGRDLIRVIDDGHGVPREEMPSAFLRHATSKIRTAEDLWSVETLGFRGEALFSIAAVGRVSLLSRPGDAAGGYELVVEGGRLVSEGVRGTPCGTVVTVRDLFYNLPARLKFLKSGQAEAAHIGALVQAYALAHPGVRFTLTSEGRLTFNSPGDSDLREAARSVYGPDVARALLPVGLDPDGELEELQTLLPDTPRVHGYVSPPAHSRSNRQAMHFFVNRRAIQSRMLLYAVEEAYHSLLMVGRHPVSVINVQISPALLDVNIHPAKLEVKFRDERVVFSAVQRAVRSALAAHVPSAIYGSRGAEGWSLAGSDQAEGLGAELSNFAVMPSEAVQHDMWVDRPGRAGETPVADLPPAPARTLPPLRVIGQVAGTYIIAEAPDGLLLVDQHAAHERILYEQLGLALEEGNVAVQLLLQPLALELPSAAMAQVEAILPAMNELGFSIEPFGESALLIRAVPAIYAASRRDLGSDLLEVLDTVMTGARPERWREEMAITLACHSAIRAGQTLALEEMRAMLVQLEHCRYPRSCAHGRPTMLHLSQMQLEREFGRRA
ncbi:MAG: DNA mismatch repair endonuclease MutL [Chloroflexota bacterium]|nr:DNA mismatch repair endonuclease MutL [Chloroflexota bacterium]